MLIKLLDEIDNNLDKGSYKKTNTIVGRFGHSVGVYEKTIHKFSATEMCSMLERKTDIIEKLHKEGIVSDDGYKEYILSENPRFTPKLIFI